jgi:hypothetical protein
MKPQTTVKRTSDKTIPDPAASASRNMPETPSRILNHPEDRKAGRNLGQLSIEHCDLCSAAFGFRRQNAQLLHQSKSVPIVPALDEPSVSYTRHRYSSD